MKRRQFLETSALGCALAISQPASLLATSSSSEHLPPAAKILNLKSSRFLSCRPACNPASTPRHQLVKKYLDRIDDIDKDGPKLNSVIEVNPDAMAIAEALDRERKEKGARGPLHGIPILIKDNIDTADRMMTTAGSLALVGSRSRTGFFRCQEVARSRRRDPGQDKPERVGKLSLEPFEQRLERAWWSDEERLYPGSQSVRFEFRIRIRCRS